MRSVPLARTRALALASAALAAAALAPATGLAAPVTDLAPGAVHTITPAETQCVASAHDDRTGMNLCPIRAYAACADGGEVDLSVIGCVAVEKGEGGAHGHYQFWFRVPPAGSGAPDENATPSFVPIHIFAPDVLWNLKLSNGSVSEDGGTASATYYLRLRRDPVDDLASRGAVVTETPILLASHGGIKGCLSIPTGWDDVANLAISCLAATSQIQQGRSSPSISAIVEVGRVYSVEIAMDLIATKRLTVKPTSVDVTDRLEMNDPPGPIADGNAMKFNKFVITVGSSTDELQHEIDELRQRFEQHSHSYLTGRGAGENSVEVWTGLPEYPAGDAASDADGDGVADIFDSCPETPAGAAVDGAGCSLDEFCAAQIIQSQCKSADWLDDEGKKPQDCRWRNNHCEAAGG